MKTVIACMFLVATGYFCQLIFKPGDKLPEAVVAAADSSGTFDTVSTTGSINPVTDSIKIDSTPQDNTIHADTSFIPAGKEVNTRGVNPEKLVSFAETLVGLPYSYASSDPKTGFDCSGFITYVFNHFGISVPRSSIEFSNVGKEIPVTSTRRGDLILFTGTDSTERFIGHMGIIVSSAGDSINFIHSSSGKANGVIITPLNDYYKGRFMKTIRVFD